MRNKLWMEIYNFIAVLSLTEGQHFEAIQSALELCGPEIVIYSICFAIKSSSTDLRMSAISCLSFLLSLEIQKDSLGKSSVSLHTVIDNNIMPIATERKENDLPYVTSNMNKLSITNANVQSTKSDESENNPHEINYNESNEEQAKLGTELCWILLHFFVAYNYAEIKKNNKQSEDKDLITSTLTNLFCISKEAKRTALEANFSETALIILKELYVKLNLQPFEFYKKQAEKKVRSIISDVKYLFMEKKYEFLYKVHICK